MRFNSITNRFTNISAIVIILIIFTIAVFFSFNGYVEFDEGVNLQVPQNIYAHHIYSTNYNGGRTFDPIISTGPTVLLPVAVSYFIANSTSVELGRLVMAFYVLLMLLGAWFLSRALYGNLAGLLITILLGCIPLLANFGIAVLGEIPAVFYCWIGILFLYHKKMNLAGLFIGLAILTKFIFLIAGIALCGTLILFWFVNKVRQSHQKNFLAFVLMPMVMIALPNVIWELLKFITLGPANYLINLNDLIGMIGINTSGNDNSFYFRVLHQFGMLATPFQSIPGWAVFLCMILALSWLLYQSFQQFRNEYFSGSLLTKVFLFIFSSGYLAWWTLDFYSIAWRHLMPGMIIIYLPICGFMAQFLKIVYGRVRITFRHFKTILFAESVLGGTISIGLLAIFFVLPVGSQISAVRKQMLDYPSYKKVQVQVAKYVSDLIDNGAHIGGWGWWQSPEISVLTNHNFIDLAQIEARNKADSYIAENHTVYLLVSPIQTSITPETWDTEKKYAGEEIFQLNGYRLFKYIVQDDTLTQRKFLIQRENIALFLPEFSFKDAPFKLK